VQRIIPDLAVIDVLVLGDVGGLRLRELAPGVSFDEVVEKTEPELRVHTRRVKSW
jgi:3-oxoacid CoA-transferase subunit B